MKVNSQFRKTFLLFSFSFFLASCLTNVEETIIEDEPETDPCTTITYTINVKPIIDNNCIQCHGSGGNFPNLTTYNGISANATSVKAEVVSRRMPQGGSLTTTEIEAITCWVDNGALNN
ncbi:cytochrome c [Polaribacter vadi]|uniref:c-type cytochrome n=1 Tax=Polaribacter TaxID=52959 RepID=UPI001C0A2A21|nr:MULTISPECIES: cytochrome c [Polaribacter]MBU3012111.1 cytochrome c [Polaribacter vadi]MDO6741927.1 cytochrome c [Polaribacter sp. 1_MG-2023]